MPPAAPDPPAPAERVTHTKEPRNIDVPAVPVPPRRDAPPTRPDRVPRMDEDEET